MASILVDYENVSATGGLKGVEYLNKKDTLIVFYSQCCEKIRAEYIEMIEKKSLNIEAEQARIQEHRAFVDKIVKAFEGTAYEKKTDNILRFMEGRDINVPKLLYTGSLHEFGREDGRVIYQMLKQMV